MTKTGKNLKGKTVLLGVSGGIAAYKAVDLASKLTAGGAKVFTIMTENACKLIAPKSFEAITDNPVFTDIWATQTQHNIGHVSLAQQADVIVVAPATANIIGKMANGICDDILSTALCVGWNKPVLIAPAMNNNMWANPAVAFNVNSLKEMGIQFIGPETGRLACGTEGPGRMSEPADILDAIEKILSR